MNILKYYYTTLCLTGFFLFFTVQLIAQNQDIKLPGHSLKLEYAASRTEIIVAGTLELETLGDADLGNLGKVNYYNARINVIKTLKGNISEMNETALLRVVFQAGGREEKTPEPNGRYIFFIKNAELPKRSYVIKILPWNDANLKLVNEAIKTSKKDATEQPTAQNQDIKLPGYSLKLEDATLKAEIIVAGTLETLGDTNPGSMGQADYHNAKINIIKTLKGNISETKATVLISVVSIYREGKLEGQAPEPNGRYIFFITKDERTKRNVVIKILPWNDATLKLVTEAINTNKNGATSQPVSPDQQSSQNNIKMSK